MSSVRLKWTFKCLANNSEWIQLKFGLNVCVWWKYRPLLSALPASHQSARICLTFLLFFQLTVGQMRQGRDVTWILSMTLKKKAWNWMTSLSPYLYREYCYTYLGLFYLSFYNLYLPPPFKLRLFLYGIQGCQNCYVMTIYIYIAILTTLNSIEEKSTSIEAISFFTPNSQPSLFQVLLKWLTQRQCYTITWTSIGMTSHLQNSSIHYLPLCMPIAGTKFIELQLNGTLCPVSPTKLPPYSPLIIFPYPLPDPYTSPTLPRCLPFPCSLSK